MSKTDSNIPAPPKLPTIPRVQNRQEASTEPPVEDNPLALMRDLRGALTNMGEKIAKLETYLMRQELAILTTEHKENTALELCDQLRERLGKVEVRLGMAAE